MNTSAWSICRSRLVLSIAVLVLAAGCESRPAPAEPGGSLLVPLPEGMQPSDLARPTRATRAALDRAIASRGPLTGDVVTFVDGEGRAILPNAERAHEVIAADNELTFTFDSPDLPFTAEQLAALEGWLASCYPIARDLYGPPAFSNTVNVRRGNAGDGFAGFYSPSTNEIVLSGVSGSTVCHEMIHAFHDDYVFGLGPWEEGFTTAAEVEVTRRAGIPDGRDHNQIRDVHHQLLNQPAIAAGGGVFGLTAYRYALWGYAWAKVLLERPDFFWAFNAAYYARAAGDAGVRRREPVLLDLASSLQPTVEGLPFPSWVAGQYIMDSSSRVGDFVYHAVTAPDQIALHAFNWASNGIPAPLAGVAVQWSAFDDTGTLFDSRSGSTGADGRLALPLTYPAGYAGRVKMQAVAQLPSGAITSTVHFKVPESEGVFGVVVGAESGSVTFTPLDTAAPPVTVPVAHGAFDAPTLFAVKGRIRAELSDGTISAPPTVFTKDEGRYFLPLAFARTFAALADADVRDGGDSGKNFGNSAQLLVRKGSSGKNRISYLQFPVIPAMAPIERATLQLFGRRSQSASVTDSAFAVASTSWSETGITWRTRPALGARQGTGVTVGTTAAVRLWDVTAHVGERSSAGAAKLSLALQMDASSNALDTFNARTAASNQPRLVVVHGADAPPTVATAPTATPAIVTGKTTALAALGADDNGEGALTYTWSVASAAPVTFSSNGTHAARNTTATFSWNGTYDMRVLMQDAAGQGTVAFVTVAVPQTPTTISISPASATVPADGARQLTAFIGDQFGGRIATPAVTWSVSGGGTIDATGLFEAGSTPGGPFTVTATIPGKTATASVTVAAP